MRDVMRASAVVTALALAACAAPPAEAPDSVPGGDRAVAEGDAVEGVVRVVGSQPVDVHVVVETEEGATVRVVGALRDEIRRLSGAVVRIEGPVEPSEMPVARRQIRADDYRIISVNGEPVIQGLVEGKTGGWTVLRTPDGEQVYLASAPEGIRTGQRVWVQGPRSVIVQSYGVIRDD